MPSREELESALDALDEQRATFGDAAVDAAQEGLRRELATVLRAERADAEPRPEPIAEAASGPLEYDGDFRPNTGMHEGEISHAEVNAAIRTAEKVILFGQQTRLRSRRLMADDRLSRIQPGHRLSKFFYGGVRQLPERLLDALLAKRISVTMVRGRDLLVFHDRRRHQAFHAGRTRRTIYIPEPILEHAYQKGYDYWAIAEILIQESWPLLDYILLLELVERCQLAYRDRATLGYRFVRDGMRELNKHMRDLTDRYQHLEVGLRKGDEMGLFLDHYLPRVFALDREIVDRDAYDVTDELYDDGWERFTGRAKLSEVATMNSFPTYFMIDRDIVHPAAFARAAELGHPDEPQTPEETIHDLWDETRFKSSLSRRCEELIDRLIGMGAAGVRGFMLASSFRHSALGPPMDLNRHGAVEAFRVRVLGYSGSGLSEVPGSAGYELRCLRDYYRTARRAGWMAELRRLPRSGLRQHAAGIRETLSQIVDESLAPPEARDLKQQIATEGDLGGLLDSVERLVQPEEKEVELTHLSGLLYRLDEHPLYTERFLPEAKALNGGQLPGPPSIRPEVQRLQAYLSDRFFELSSDPADLGFYRGQLQETDQSDPYNRLLFTWIAACLIRYDRSPDYPELCMQVALLGEYAVPPLQEIVASPVYYGADGREGILRAAQLLLPKLPDCRREVRDEWNEEINRRRGIELDDGRRSGGRRSGGR